MKKRAKTNRALVPADKLPRGAKQLLGDLRGLIDAARTQTAQVVNTGLVLLYWHIGERIHRDILKAKRAGYGEQIVAALSQQLTAEYGKGFTRDNLLRMIQLAERFPDLPIVGTLSRQLGWSHFVELIPLDDPLKRDFYAEMCRLERWSVRTLRKKIDGMLFERTAISRKPAELARKELKALRDEDRLTPDLVFRDPYLLDFLALRPTVKEEDVRRGLLEHLRDFLIELGTGFAYVGTHYHLEVGGQDYYLDLLFYHRGLRRLVAIELKLGQFQAADKGQMELYLRWLEKYEQRPGEETPLGLILCAGKSAEHVELLHLDDSGIRVAQYLSEVLPQALLEKKLHEAVTLAREQLARRSPAGAADTAGDGRA
jgi:predicted nuclease of restriction endonuclease-like (RecB) superfamily